MISVACGMDDNNGNDGIDGHYDNYKKRCDLEGMVAMSEFDWIGRVVIRNPVVKFPTH